MGEKFLPGRLFLPCCTRRVRVHSPFSETPSTEIVDSVIFFPLWNSALSTAYVFLSLPSHFRVDLVRKTREKKIPLHTETVRLQSLLFTFPWTLLESSCLLLKRFEEKEKPEKKITPLHTETVRRFCDFLTCGTVLCLPLTCFYRCLFIFSQGRVPAAKSCANTREISLPSIEREKERVPSFFLFRGDLAVAHLSRQTNLPVVRLSLNRSQ